MESKFLERIRIWERPPWSGTAQIEAKNKIFFEENQTGLLQSYDKTHHGLMVKPKVIFGLSQEISFTVITWNPESNCTCRPKNPSLFHWNTSTLPAQHTRHWMFVREKYWWSFERGWRKRIIRCMDTFHKIYLIKRRATRRTHMVRWRLMKKRTTPRPDKVWLDMWKHMSDASKRKAKQKWAIEKPKLDNARIT